MYSKRIKCYRRFHDRYMSFESNHETNSATSSNLCVESKTENIEKVVTKKICCCRCESNSQYNLNVDEYPKYTSHPRIQVHYS